MSHVIAIAGEDDDPPQSFVLLVESNHFREIPDGELIPFIEAVFTRKTARPPDALAKEPGAAG